MKSSKKIIGRTINIIRKRKRLTLKELADKLDSDKQYIWKLENGKINITAPCQKRGGSRLRKLRAINKH